MRCAPRAFDAVLGQNVVQGEAAVLRTGDQGLDIGQLVAEIQFFILTVAHGHSSVMCEMGILCR